MEVALAAVKLAHESGVTEGDETHIPDAVPAPSREQGRGPGRPGRPAGSASRDGGRPAARAQGVHRSGRRHDPALRRRWARAGIRPQDLVGAIANEAGLNGRQIGAIEIADRFSLVEVPEASADAVVPALRGRMIKGKKTTVRRERFGAKPRHRAS